VRVTLIGIAVACLIQAETSAVERGEYMGATSCAASTCHGGVIDRGPRWHQSFSIWLASDPHAGAGFLLRNDDSRRIVERLEPAAAKSPQAFDRVLRSRCISCHVTVTSDECTQRGLLDDRLLSRGVSCESCHGPARPWLREHVRADWVQSESAAAMTDTESIIGRAETCVPCHVGSRSSDGLIRDVNHDLIAAGHPALRFDLLIYSENLPQHWDGDRDVRFSESAVRIRNVGRAINMSAAAMLSSERAGDHLQDSSVPWAELADYDCFGCHQSLSMKEFRLPAAQKQQVRSPLRVSDGLPIWNPWHSIGQLDISKQQLKLLAPNRADAQAVAAQAPGLARLFREKATEHVEEPVDAGAHLRRQRDVFMAAPPRDWHSAAVLYLEIEAALRDLSRDADEQISSSARQRRQSIGGLEQLLRFDQSRPGGRPARYDSPIGFNPEKFQRTAIELLDLPPVHNRND
jgi:hypothetical protein